MGKVEIRVNLLPLNNHLFLKILKQFCYKLTSIIHYIGTLFS